MKRITQAIALVKVMSLTSMKPGFCQQAKGKLGAKEDKSEILKTYLEIIPPHRLQAIVGKEKLDVRYMEDKENKEGEMKQLKQSLRKVKMQGYLMEIQNLSEVMETLSEVKRQDKEAVGLIRKINNRIIEIFRKKINFLSVEQLVNFVYKLVKLNHKEFEVMKEVERVLIEQKIRIEYPIIRKILWAYTHLDAGSAVLYSHVSKTIKIGQHELAPLELAEAAYMLSKVSENASGGFGVFSIAEKHVENHLSRLKFHELVKASSFLLTQNIGSNRFQCKLEQEIYNKFPDRATLRLNDLVELLKSTAVYYFKFKDNALLHTLRASTEKFAPFATLEQFEDMIWSWGRSGRGDAQLWRVLEKCVADKFIKSLTIRQTAFFYYSLSCSEHATLQILGEVEGRFIGMVGPETNEHYLIKMMLGLQKRGDCSNPLFLKLAHLISDRIPKLSNKELISFARSLNQSDFHFENKPEQMKEVEQSLVRVSSQIQSKIYAFGPHEITELLYLWIKLDIPDPAATFVNHLFAQLDANVLDIPKPAFIKAIFCFVVRDRYSSCLRMVPILYELMRYGPLGYFFSPLEAPLLAFSILHLSVNSEGSLRIHDHLIEEMKAIVESSKPEMLNDFVRKGYEEAKKLSEKV